MTSQGKHHKHPPLAKPNLGEWGRNEIAILGAPCPLIRTLASEISKQLSSKHNVCYVDADHAETDNHTGGDQTFNIAYTDKIDRHRIDLQHSPGMYERRAMLSGEDVILVNGNHFTAQAQIVLLHSKKLESLERKSDRLTNVIAVVEIDVTLEAFPFLNTFLQTDTRVFRSGEEVALITWLETRVTAPPIKALVLAGGRSVRMGTDKSVIEYHGKPQREHLLHLLTTLGLPAYLSCRPDQLHEMHSDFPLLTDRVTELGPYGAILSAMMTAPDSAWLIVATDLPYVTEETIRHLVENRNPAKIASAFLNPSSGFPEPLITLWEPKAYPVLLSFLAQGNVCPRKALINSDVHIIEAQDPRWLTNINTREDIEALKKQWFN